jgi:hypothetical protein
VRASFRSGPEPAVAVAASDAVGLDFVEIAAAEDDSVYRSQLSGARTVERVFPLRDLFPGSRTGKNPARVTVTVRSTRGRTASASVRISPSSDHRSQTP